MCKHLNLTATTQQKQSGGGSGGGGNDGINKMVLVKSTK
jgi:hypothetical protein